MTLILEDGTGVSGAESYASVAQITAYWGARLHDANATAWLDADFANQEGAAREASAYLDAVYGPYYKGSRAGYVQGLQWPRTQALDAAGYPLPGKPVEIQNAVCELAVRALSARLAEDDDRGNQIIKERVKIDVIEEEIQYADGAQRHTSYGHVAGMLEPILNGSQPGAANPTWLWR